MTSTTTGRRPKFTLHRDGFEDCAELDALIAQIRGMA